MTNAAQRAAERRHLEQLLHAESLDATIERHGDAPDFILRLGDWRIGLDHTELNDELLSRAAARVKSFEASLLAELRRDGVGVDIEVTVLPTEGAALFAYLGRKDVAKLARRIGELSARAQVGLQPGASTDVGAANVAMLHGGIEIVAVQRIESLRSGPLCHVQTAHWGTGDDAVLAAIRTKELRLAKYRGDESLVEVWLLLVIGDTASQIVDLRLVRDELFDSGYDRVYLLDARAAKSRRIDAGSAM